MPPKRLYNEMRSDDPSRGSSDQPPTDGTSSSNKGGRISDFATLQYQRSESKSSEESHVPKLSDLALKKLDMPKILLDPQYEEYANQFIQTGVGKEWLQGANGKLFLRSRAHEFLKTEQGKEWYKAKGEQWLQSKQGQV